MWHAKPVLHSRMWCRRGVSLWSVQQAGVGVQFGQGAVPGLRMALWGPGDPGWLAQEKDPPPQPSCVINWVQPHKPWGLPLVHALLLLLHAETCRESSFDTCPAGSRWGNSPLFESPQTEGASHHKHGTTDDCMLVSLCCITSKIPCEAFRWSLDPKTSPMFPPVWTEQYPGNHKLPHKADFPKENKRDLRLKVMSMQPRMTKPPPLLLGGGGSRLVAPVTLPTGLWPTRGTQGSSSRKAVPASPR